MHCSAKLSVTVHKFTISHPQLFPLVRLSLAAEPQTFLLRVVTWVRSVLGANVTFVDILCSVEYHSVIKIKVHNVFLHSHIHLFQININNGFKYVLQFP